MKTFLVSILIGLASVAEAGFSNGLINQTATTVGVSTANRDLYVETTGNDAYDCATISTPCLTIQGALIRLKGGATHYVIRHLVTIHVGAGNFAGFLVTGFSVELKEDAYGTQLAHLSIQGTMADVSGTGFTGTLTGWTALGTNIWPVATNTNVTMTVNAAKGYYLQLLTGTGSTATVGRPGPYFEIISNTATAYTLAGTSTAGAASTTYKVVTPSTFITSGTVPATGSGSIGNLNYPGGSSGAIFVQNEGVSFGVSQMEFSLGASLTRGVVVQETRTSITACRFIATSGTVFGISYGVSHNPVSAPIIYGVYMNLVGTSNSSGLTLTAASGSVATASPSITATHIVGGLIGLGIGGTSAPSLLSSVKFESQTFAAINIGGFHGGSQWNNLWIDAAATGISYVQGNTSGSQFVTFAVNGGTISNCTVAGVSLSGRGASFIFRTVTGTANLVGAVLAKGAWGQYDSTSSTLTGTTEITLDGVSETLVNMRAASPKFISNTYGTTIYE